MSRALSIGILVAAFGCQHEQTSSTAPPPTIAATQRVPQSTARHPLGNECPTEVPGTIVNVDRFDGGIALVFTTLIGDVNDLRARVHHTAEQIERERPAAPDRATYWDRLRAMAMPPAGVDPVDYGLRFVLAQQVGAALFGTTQLAHLEAAIAAVERGPLDPAEARAAFQRCDRGWDGVI